ncbi:MAG: hypothetical protein ABJG42_24185 [Vibrio splendidus]
MENILLFKEAGSAEAKDNRLTSEIVDISAVNNTVFYHVTGDWAGAEARVEIRKYGHDVWMPIEETRTTENNVPLILDLRYGCEIRIVITGVAADTKLTASL